ncbi:UDP-galactose transporter senju isoform X1 [Linepithema humile]|uniref:UDP-galactose transporter senju isoform X1 n=1 Tax=Linepithema humile TaxID=83485 RepID=UPI0006232DF0|nr:PREDICTED: CMP-sialic acid transporter 4 isoform X1 [Linepithema humile]
MGGVNWSELFPGRWSPVIFISYITLFINQGILVTWSQRSGHYEYNIVAVVLMTEVLKLIISTALYCKDNSILTLLQEIKKNKKVLLLYMVPAFLYCLYNNLAFVNLARFDPTTYYVLLQLRVVFTGIIFQVIFSKKLSGIQWVSLVILTIGCMVKHFDVNVLGSKFHVDIFLFLMLIQTICSCLAGVYNEYLLKRQGADIDIFVQNVFMYIDSIFCNIVAIVLLSTFKNSVNDTFSNVEISASLQPKVILIMLNNALVGIITSFFLKTLNSILKTFASAMELIFTATLCWILFNIPININTVISIAMVSFAVILYSRNPVQNTQPKETAESEMLLV